MDQEEKILSTLLTELRVEEAALSISGGRNKPDLIVSENFELPEAELHVLDMAGREQLKNTTSVEEQTARKYTRCSLNVDTSLICKSCLKGYQEPRILPCLHTFCSECISKFDSYKIRCLNASDFSSSTSSVSNSTLYSKPAITASQTLYPNLSSNLKTGKDSHFIVCPICKQGVKISNNVVKNNFVERKLELEAMQSDDSPICDLCVVSNERNAVARCFDCQQVLCELCSNAHLRQRGTNNHHLVYMKAHDANKILNVLLDSMFCRTHPVERLKMYCESCELLVCRDCVLSEHRNHVCNFITDIQEAETNKIRIALTSIKLRVGETKSQSRSLIDAKIQIKKESEKVRTEVNSFIDSYIRAIEVHRNVLLDQVNGYSDEKLQKIENQQDAVCKHVAELEESCDFIETILEEGDQSEILQLKSLIVQRLSELTSKSDNFQEKLEESSSDAAARYAQFCHRQKGEIIDNFQMFGRIVEKRSISPDLCVLSGNGLSTARVARKSRMNLKITGKRGTPVRMNPESIEVSLICSRNLKNHIPMKIVEGKDETFHLIFCPADEGQHHLSVAINGKAIKDSPFKFNVKPKWRLHRGVWQCCTFCSTGGRKNVSCGCGGVMPGYLGCGHSYGGHPGAPHWSCCGKLIEDSECFPRRSVSLLEVRHVTL